MFEKFKDSKFVFVVGIGGSDLASKAVWNALTLHEPEVNKKLFFLESPDSREYEEVEYFVNNEIAQLEEVCLIAISKSGKTVETLEAFHKTFDMLSEKFGKPISERALVISSKDTPLFILANDKNIKTLEWDGDIGGRWSAFTIAHQAVLSIAGLDTEAFLVGSKEIDPLAGMVANKIFENYRKGFDILDLFFFNTELEDLGKWCRQLIAESLGKESGTGEKVGITPVVSIGPTDLHSMLQLTLGGPKNKFTLFVVSIKEISSTINQTAYKDTVQAYEENSLPFEKYEMDEINEKNLGRFMAFLMTVTLTLAKLLEVNPYDQPQVEKYKSEIRSTKS